MSLLAEEVRTAVDRGLGEGRTMVFPSQLAADFWKTDVLRRAGGSPSARHPAPSGGGDAATAGSGPSAAGAATSARHPVPSARHPAPSARHPAPSGGAGTTTVVRADRFISWDTFKERTSGSHDEKAPANSALRRLAAQSLALENIREPFLSRVIPRDYHRESTLFTDYIRQGLTGLAALTAHADSLDPALTADVGELKRRYERILDAGGYFEPAWVPPSLDTRGRRYTVLFPSLIEDFEEFLPLLPGEDTVELVRLPEHVDEHNVPVLEYSDSLLELRAAFDHIESLLAGGASRRDIAITVGDLDGLRDELSREARRRGLPLGLRAGVPLSDHPAGRIFARIGECVETNFHPDSVKKLVHHGAIPWRDAQRLQLLAEFGIAHGCLGGSAGKPAAAWQEAFAAGGGRRFRKRAQRNNTDTSELSKLFELFRRSLSEIVHAPGFEELRTALYAFLKRFVDTDRWGSEVEPVFQRCMLSLSEWIETSARSGLGVEAPFTLFLGGLAESIYVKPADRRGIPVYPYRVAAGTAPLHHIVIGASRSAISIPVRRLPFLRDDEREYFETSSDPTGAFFRAYSASGDNVRISCPRESAAGAQIAPPGKLEEVQPAEGVFEREQAAFAGDLGVQAAEFPARMYPVQRYGYERYRKRAQAPTGSTGAAGNAAAAAGEHGTAGESRAPAARSGLRRDRRYSALPRRAFGRLLDGLLDEEDRLNLWPSTIEKYTSAPFSCLYNDFLKIREEDWALSLFDPRSEGTLLHDLVRAGERMLESANVSYGSADLEQLSATLEETMISQLSHSAIVDSPVPAALLRMERSGILADALGVFKTLAKYFPDFVPTHQEWTINCAPFQDVALSGRVDSASRSGDRTVIIDFKRGVSSIPSASDIANMNAPQLPVYTLIAEEKGYRVETAAYLAAHNSSRVSVAVGERPAALSARSQVGVSSEQWPEHRASLLEKIETLADRMFELDFRCPSPKLGCDGCRTRAVCRAKYGHSERQL